mgnify:CR=1 FL=1
MLEQQGVIRISVFVTIFLLMAAIEAWRPARQAQIKKRVRWQANLAMVVVGALVGRVVLPATVVGVALWAQSHGYGLFHQVSVPGWLVLGLSLLVLDCTIYWQHRLFHQIPLLWRLHRVHHADSHVDTTTGLRFHPLEIALSLFVKAAMVLILGIPALAVLIFEVALNGFAIFNHANIRLPQAIDDKVGWFVITQRLHRIHHSQYGLETNRNFGFSVSWWDRLFKSFCARGKLTDYNLKIGQRDCPATNRNARLWTLLVMPFKRQKTGTNSSNKQKVKQ